MVCDQTIVKHTSQSTMHYRDYWPMEVCSQVEHEYLITHVHSVYSKGFFLNLTLLITCLNWDHYWLLVHYIISMLIVKEINRDTRGQDRSSIFLFYFTQIALRNGGFRVRETCMVVDFEVQLQCLALVLSGGKSNRRVNKTGCCIWGSSTCQIATGSNRKVIPSQCRACCYDSR